LNSNNFYVIKKEELKNYYLEEMMDFDFGLLCYSIAAFVFVSLILAGLILWTKRTFSYSASCKVYINDDEKMTKTCPVGATLLSALSHEGVPIPSPCGGKATCKQCRLKIIEGADEPLETDRATFSKRQLGQGWRLSCQTKLYHDIKVHIDEALIGVRERTCKVVSNQNVATFIKELIIELPEGEEMHYRSGGYVEFHVPPYCTDTSDWKETIDQKYWKDWEKYGMFGKTIDYSTLSPYQVMRAYSMASYPAEGRKLIFNVRVATPPLVGGKVAEEIPWGICSSYMFSLKAGDTVKISGPYGESFMIDDSRDLYFLIGGVGSSFARAHILHLFYTEKTKRKVSLWYGARALRENIYQDEYERLGKLFSNFQYHLVLSEPEPEDIAAGWPKADPIKSNFLFKAFELGALKNLEAPEEALYYVCGPPLHNKSVLKLLDDWGVPRENIILDDFGS
jgi:Na+-transporting NADH:ubiquinone oxidoreductase subunit F